ncbi:hypothetical protein RSAG8_10106, partial [Rhizoctonia solani AG-8 WAC10335]
MPYSSQAKPGSRSKPAGVDQVNEENISLENVRTLASTEYFDDWAGHGAWPIVISNRAVGDLRQLRRRDGHVFRMCRSTIVWLLSPTPITRELSQGFFSNDNQKRLEGLKAEVPIYEAKVSRDLRIVYQIDIDTDVKRQSSRQIIKIYGVYTHAQMDNRLWSLVSHYHASRRGKEYRDQCSARETARTPGNNVTLPFEFPCPEDDETPKEPQLDVNSGTDHSMNDDDLSAVRSVVVFEKFMLMSKSLVKSIVDDLDGAHVFQVSAKEKEVIYYDSASFVLGRSGTGKTTCIVFKMLGIERMFEEGDEAKPRQVFITQSPALAQKVQEYYRSLIQTYSYHSVLHTQATPGDKGILADLRDEAIESFGLPSRYSLLEDRHFPLFLSFDQFCSLLEEDYIFKFGHSARSQAIARRFNPSFTVGIDEEFKSDPEYFHEKLLPAVRTMEKIKENKHASVTFDVFAFAYWPHFDEGLTYGLDPALVYNEFIGIIEGSEDTLNSESGVLSRDDYLALSQGNSLLSSRRDRIYTLYESYRRARGQLGGYDAAERTHALLVATQNGKRIPGPKIDALYIDEVQDNLLIDSKLLLNFSDNPHGILMAGDTAQTISAGSSFRFEDLKAFFWRLEEQDKAVRAKKRKPIHPVLFHLSVNYRSHGGIVDCASALVELVSELFPNSIDKLKREAGLIEGPKPIFFSGWEQGSIQIDQFLRDQGDVQIDFGANQVILVRNNAAREALRAQVGEIGLILTLYESKGLEFNDVLLYNFFEDSVASATTWRIVLHGLDSSRHRSLPQFDPIRHAIICSELKNLYVGLTRARSHCWIWDISERAEPMKEYWTEQNLIEKCGPGDPIPRLGESSLESEWEEQGRTLFERELYPQAMLCFQRAGLVLESNIAAAYQARKEARLLQATKSNDRETRTAFHYAAKKFLECSKIATSKQQTSCYLRAADCFVQAEEWKPAAETFIIAQDFGMAAKCFRNAGCFSEAVETVQTHSEDIQQNVAEEIIKVARLEYLRTAQYEQAEELFDDLDEQLEYMEDCGLESARIEVLEQHQRHEEAAEAAAEAAFGKGDLLEGLRLLQSSNDPQLLRRAIEKALGVLWTLFPFRHQVDSENHTVADALIQYVNNEPRILTKEETHQIDVFRAIRTGNQARIGSLAQSHGIFASNSPYRSTLSLLCFSYSSDTLLTWKYFVQLSELIQTLDMSKLPTQRLLGVEPAEHRIVSTESSESGFRIYSTSPMFSRLKSFGSGALVHHGTLNVTSMTSTESYTRRLAIDTLYSVLRAEALKMHTAAASPNFLALQHVNSLRLSETDRQVPFNQRVRALVMQIYLANKYYPQTRPEEFERGKLRRTWIHKIHEALMPLFPPLGGLRCVDSAWIPELSQGGRYISTWCEQTLFELGPYFGAKDRFLSEVLASLDLVFHIDGNGFESYAHRLHSARLVKIREDLMITDPRTQHPYSILHCFIDFYHRKSDNIIQRVLQAIQHVVFNGLVIEANILVYLLEFIGREIIVQCRRWFKGKDGIFDGLLVPRSWALDLLKRAPLATQKGVVMLEYLGTLYRTLEILRGYKHDFSGKGALNPLGRGILILRICRLIVLVSSNTFFDLPKRIQVRQNISRALTGPGEIHHYLCDRLLQNKTWEDLEDTILRCPLNRGADQLVRLFLRRGNNYRQPRSSGFIRAVGYNRIPDLERLLSLTDFAQRPQSTLNPEAKPFNPPIPGQPSSENRNDAPEFEKVLDQEDGDTTGLMRSDNEEIGIDALPETQPEPTRYLTPDEIKSGKIILLVLRRHVLRKRARQRSAVMTIWKCYSRYLDRRDAPRSAADERYLRFQREYINDVKVPENTRPLPGSFYRYKAILLGCMPHVAVYLRGLEHANQLKKHANRKRLQTAHHKELEEIQAMMDACSKFTTELKRLRPAIMPGSNKLNDLRALQTHVKELEKIYREMEKEFGGDEMLASLEHHRRGGVSIILAQSI